MEASHDAEERICSVIEGNPAYRELYIALIDYCAEERTLEEAQAFCEAHRISPMQVLGASALVDVMVRAGALELAVLVDGRPYEGTLADLQADEAVPEDAAVTQFVRATPAGRAATASMAEERSFARLTAACPGREPAFRAVLGWCAEGDGATTRRLQELLKEADLLETEAARGIDGLHASYFTGALESVGALAWNGKAWVATAKGQSLIECA